MKSKPELKIFLSPRVFAPWIRLIAAVLVVALYNAYGGGHQLAQARERGELIADANLVTLGLLKPEAALTPALIEQRKAEARQTIARTRAKERAMLAANKAEARRLADGMWRLQDQSNLLGLSRLGDDITEHVRRVTEQKLSDRELLQEGRDLWFLGRSFSGLRGILKERGALPEGVDGRVLAVERLLEGLGPHPSQVSVSEVRGVTSRLRQQMESWASEGERDTGRRHPLFGSRDKLTGKVKLELPGNRVRPLQDKPSQDLPFDLATLRNLYRDVPSAEFSASRQASLGAPTSADTAPSTDVVITPAIQNLANSLGKDPLAIFNWVAGNIDYLVYAGSLYGAAGTLDIKAGNDVDQASLLIALLRASGIPARYETGTAYMPAAMVTQTTGFQNVLTASSALLTLGVNNVVVYMGNTIDALKVTRTWVRAYVPYTNYRGLAGSAGGSPMWVALDPALKHYSLENKVEMPTGVEFDVNGFVSAPQSRTTLEFYQDAIRSKLQATGTKCESIDDVLTRRVMTPEALPILPTTLPYDVVGSTVAAADLSSGQRVSLSFEATDPYGDTLISYSQPFSVLYGKRVALTFPSGSGIYSSLSGYVKPTLSVDGAIVSQGYGVQVGSEIPVYVSITAPGVGTTSHDHLPVAGGSYVFSNWLGPVPSNITADAADDWADLKGAGAAQNQQDLAIGELAGLTYHTHLYNDDVQIYGLNGWLHGYQYEAMAGTSVTPIYFWGIPSGAKASGYLIDAENSAFAAPLEGSYSTSGMADLLELSGYNGSYHEHKVWESVLSVGALSSTNVLQLARTQGQPVYFFDSVDDYYAVRSSMNHPSNVLSNVENFLNNGGEVVISQRQVTKGQKTVSGYVLFDPATGSGQYLINTQLNGGETTDPLTEFLSAIASMFGLSIPISSLANVADGSISDAISDFTIYPNGQMRQVSRHYQSESTLSSEVGTGWGWTFGERLFEESGSGNITRLMDIGTRLTYTKNADGSYSTNSGIFDVLTKGSSGFTLTYKDGRALSFDLSGRMTQEKDRFGNLIKLIRDSSGALDKITTGDGKLVLEITCDSAGLITKMEDAAARSIQLSYSAGRMIQVTDARNKTWRYTYDALGKVVGKEEGDGTPISYSWDGNGRIGRYTTANDGAGYFAYDEYNKRSTVKSPSGSESVYASDKDGHLTESIDPEGNKETLTWSGGMPTQYVDSRGGVSTQTFDSKGNVTSQKDVTGATTTMTWDNQNRPLTRSGPEGTSSVTYDDVGRKVTVKEADGTTESYTFNTKGLPTSVTHKDGSTSTQTYDTNGFTTSRTEGGVTYTFTNDALGRATSAKTSDGAETKYEYEPGGMLKKLDLPGGIDMDLTWNAHGQVEKMVDGNGQTITYTYERTWVKSVRDNLGRGISYQRDGEGRVVGTTDHLGNSTTYQLDGLGRSLSTTDRYGKVTEFGFCADVASGPCDIIDPFGNLLQRFPDSSGRITTETTALGTWSYDYPSCVSCVAATDPIGVTDPLGHHTEWTRDARGNLLKVEDALGQITQYTYDQRDQVTSMRDASGALTQYVRDTSGRVTDIIDALDRVTHFQRNSTGRIVSKTDPNGNLISYTHDAMGRILSEQFPSGESRTFAYDSMGRKTRSTNDTRDLEYFRDGAGRVTRVIDHTLDKELSITYDPATGMRSSLTRPDGVQKYTYDRYGRPSAITLPNGKVVTMVYDEFGRLSQKKFPNNVIEKNTYDRWSRLSSRLYYDRSGLVLMGRTYTYDALSRRTSVTDHQGKSTTYSYDALGRLIKEVSTGMTREYSYDEVGNRLSTKENGATTESYTYDETHRLLSRTAGGVTTTYTHDDNGNLLQKKTGNSTTSYTWDDADELVAASVPGKVPNTFTYDAEGRRADRSNSDGEFSSLYDEEDVVAEFDAGGDLSHTFTHGNGVDDPLAMSDGADSSNTHYYHTDALGSVIGMTNSAGQVSHRYSYGSFGQLSVGQEDTYNPLTYTGRPYDTDTGLYDLRARQLDSGIGRFISHDPRSLVADEMTRSGTAAHLSGMGAPSTRMVMGWPQLLHAYTYVGNAPLDWTDPSGEFIWLLLGYLLSMLIWAIVMAVIFGMLGAIMSYSVSGSVDWEVVESMACLGAVIGAIMGLVFFGPIPLGPAVMVSNWGTSPIVSGAWVIVGRPSIYNWIRTCVFYRTPFAVGRSITVPASALKLPPLTQIQAWLLGHWRYFP